MSKIKASVVTFGPHRWAYRDPYDAKALANYLTGKRSPDGKRLLPLTYHGHWFSLADWDAMPPAEWDEITDVAFDAAEWRNA